MTSFLARTFSKLNTNISQFLVKTESFAKPAACFHTSAVNAGFSEQKQPRNFLRYNKKIFPPQQPNEEPRPAVNYFYIIALQTKGFLLSKLMIYLTIHAVYLSSKAEHTI